jgi:ABC-2 type transport system ATP-binding protein
MKSPVIEVNGLSKFYGKTRGIEHIDLEVQEGEIFGFIGPNGAGKSTTIRILLNLIFPTAGHANIMGMDVTRDSRKIRQLTGYVPSDANAYRNMETGEFLSFCMRFYGFNDNPGLTTMANLFDLDLKRRISDLSMGNRKKVSIIQSLLHNPKLLILDEPTTGLDPLMQSRFFELLKSENSKGMTIFFSSHVLSEIQMLCKRVAIVKDGRIIKVEDIDTLRRKQLKKVSILFKDKMSAESFRIPGYDFSALEIDKSLSFMYSGPIDELLAQLSGKKIDDMTIEEPSLEEIFMHYYQ